MALTLATAARNAACDAVVDLVDAAATAGKAVIKTAADAVIGTFVLGDPAFGDAAAGVATANAIAQVQATGAGVATKFDLTDGDDNVILQGTVGEPASGADMIFTNTDFNVDDNMDIDSWTITVPAT